MDAFFNIIFQIGVMIILIMCGFVLFKTGMISKETNKQLSDIVISVVNPALMFKAYNIEMNRNLVQGLLQAALIAIVTHILFIAVSKCLIRKKRHEADYGLERYCSTYSNCAFIGIPLVSSVYGTEGVFYVTAYITVFNLLMWSHGIILLQKDQKENIVKKIVLSPAIIATILGLIVFIFQIHVPRLVLEPIGYIGSMNTPLAMIVSGAVIAQTDFIGGLKRGHLWIVAAIKLLIIPLFVMIACSFIDMNRQAVMSTIIVAACPTATASTLLAIKYNLDEKYAAQIFGTTTVLSAITLPMLLLLGTIVF